MGPHPAFTLSIRALAGLAASLALAGAFAQTTALRTLPEDARRGVLSHVRENLVTLDGKQTRLAPGAQIRGANNLIVVPTAVPKDSLVKYQLSAGGELFRAWVLTAEEAKRPDPAAAPPDSLEKGRPFSEIVSPQTAPAAGRPGKP